MTVNRKSLIPRTLLAAGLLLCVAAADAAGGYSITESQEALVSPGMTQSDVKQALGQPARAIQYPNESGPTFTYGIVDMQGTLFDVDFGADGKVASVDERVGGPGSH
ncbi:MAG: hypothetical protein ABI564_01190 [Ideonella sp.]